MLQDDLVHFFKLYFLLQYAGCSSFVSINVLLVFVLLSLLQCPPFIFFSLSHKWHRDKYLFFVLHVLSLWFLLVIRISFVMPFKFSVVEFLIFQTEDRRKQAMVKWNKMNAITKTRKFPNNNLNQKIAVHIRLSGWKQEIFVEKIDRDTFSASMRFIIVQKSRPIILKRNDCASIWMQSSVKTCLFFHLKKRKKKFHWNATWLKNRFACCFIFLFFCLLKPIHIGGETKCEGSRRKIFLSQKYNGINFSSWIEGFTRNQKFVEWKRTQVFHESINGH